MPSYRDINALSKDPAKVRSTAQFLLTLNETNWSDWELDFLDSMSNCAEELSTRQAEKLVELRDDAMRFTSASGFRFATVIEKCWRNRLDLNSDEDCEFVDRLKKRGETALRRRDAFRLRRIAIELGELEPHQSWAMTSSIL